MEWERKIEEMLDEILELKMLCPDWVRDQLLVRILDVFFANEEGLFSGDDEVLYICFAKYGLDNVISYVIESIKLNTVLSSPCSISCPFSHLPNRNCSIMHHDCSSQLQLEQKWLLSLVRIFRPMSAAVCSDQNSFCRWRERQIFEFETDWTLNPNRSITLQTQVFRGRKALLLLQEIEGKLYALASYQLSFHASPYFLVFDPQEAKWSPLSDPPAFLRFNTRQVRHSPQQYCFTIAGTNVIMSCVGEPIYRFDVADLINKVCRVLPGIPLWDLNFTEEH
ncbi:unnamed protein product [Prunus armeniaca]|uniref:Uncharacterized protein n=1 Tax=Prunus armeniaca TaxID=36596 RepID=A0A6J5XF60_PRUAR|nr:unnamed protein product [Prunus armeniaca]